MSELFAWPALIGKIGLALLIAVVWLGAVVLVGRFLASTSNDE